MIAEDGTIFENTITYHEIVPNEKIVYSNKSSDGDGSDEFLTIITFDNVSNDTRVIVKMIFQTIEHYHMQINKVNAERGLQQTLDRLQEFLHHF